MAVYRTYLVIAAIIAIGVAAYAAYNAYAAGQPYSIRVALSVSPQVGLYPYDTSNITIKVSNTGGIGISNMPLDLYLNTTELRAYGVTLQPGQNATIEYNYTFTSPGSYSFQAIADPAELFRISDRSGAQSAAVATVAPAENPDVYTSIPNNGVMSTQAFTLSGTGLAFIWLLAHAYNISSFSGIFGPSAGVTGKTLSSLSQYISVANGAQATYYNGSKAYTVWLEGPVTPGTIAAYVSSFGSSPVVSSLNGTPLYYFALNGTTSACAYYAGGWTRFVTVYNNSRDYTCASLSSTSFNATESSRMSAALKNDSVLRKAPGMTYSGASLYGSSLSFNTSALGFQNFFANQYGFFDSYVLGSVQAPQNATCYGLITLYNRTSVCSSYVLPRNGTLNTSVALLDSAAIGRNYTIGIYSMVDRADITSAYTNAGSLLNAFNVSQAYTVWLAPLRNSCGFKQNAIGCHVENFNPLNASGTLALHNGMNSSIVLRRVSCFLSNLPSTEYLNTSIAQGQNATVPVSCSSLTSAVVSAETSYVLALNYTVSGSNAVAAGTLNVTNFA